ncbi:DUF1402 family protein [Pseudobdellovibrio exovorus]|uniref:Transglycosylase SLT domain-containing protein n=1 Tax=Pseudobdellovibrio exovorus JSS TaxID=1184267 RepID=M4V5D1_9BACT|nr:DUF1402 family protein [Pseudobdellovibrio exovorus]AGH94393.1 hypothetical protein A11Q_173 [Pseudobdellovibrio exovorus JSS]
MHIRVKQAYHFILQSVALVLMATPVFASSLSVYDDLNQAFHSNSQQGTSGSLRVAAKGNGLQAAIPAIPRLAQARAAVTGDLPALLSLAKETEFALALGKSKIPQILDALNEQGLLAEAVKLAEAFQIHPLHILGPIIGENSFNGAIDKTIQDSFAKMFTEKDFRVMSSRMQMIVDDPQTQGCMNLQTLNYWKWRCLLHRSSYLANGSNRDFIWWFYQISNKGKGTFGLGQVQPFLLWSVSDIVAEKTAPLGYNYKTYSLTDMKEPFKIVFRNKEMLAYIAAMAYVSIQVYKSVGQIDISQNAGLTTTLYNVGDEYQRAYYFLKKNGSAPEVNYMGWYINHFENEIQNYLETKELKY